MRAVPITALPRGWLYRAVVDLPDALREPGRPLQCRLVFFEHDSLSGASTRLVQLLDTLWNKDPEQFHGCIYDVTTADETLAVVQPHRTDAGELRLLESGRGGDGPCSVGEDRTRYWRAADVDLFVTPRVAARLRDLLAQVEAMYAAEPARRARAAAVAQGDIAVPAPVFRAHHDPVARLMGHTA